MKTGLKTLAAITTLFIADPNAEASQVIVSNLEAGETAARLNDSNGAALPVGTEIRVGYFDQTTDHQIPTITRTQGIAGIDSVFTDLGPSLFLGTGAGNVNGRLEQSVPVLHFSTSLPLYGIVYNASSAATAGEVLIVRFIDGRVENDLAIGLSGLTAVHFKNAAIVVGSSDEDGLRTAPPATFETGYELWIAGFSLNATDAQPGSDPDSDQSNNLREYALGSVPDDAGSVDRAQVIREGDQSYIVFQQRVDDALINYQLEFSSDLGGGWATGSMDFEIAEEREQIVLDGYRLVRGAIPAAGVGFARIRVIYWEAP